MKISVIVPAFNEEKLLAVSLRRIREAMTEFALRGWDSELIVCDNNSTDRTPIIAAEAGATVVFEPVNQISRARNRGASAASGDWLVFIDADSWPSRSLFRALITRIDSGRVIGGGCAVRMESERFRARVLELLWNGISRMTRWAAGSFVYCDAAAFRAVGGFSTQLYASEEIDLSKRLKAHGKKEGKKFAIISNASLVTSARKFNLYSRKEFTRFFIRAIARPRATIGSREACHVWYDGRR